MKYKGWIIADYKDKEFLEKLGIKLGQYNEETNSFENCEVPIEIFDVLDNYWGRFYWGLFPEKKEIKENNNVKKTNC